MAPQTKLRFAKPPSVAGTIGLNNMEPGMEDELLLIMTNLGYEAMDEETGERRFVCVQDAIYFLEDMQR